MNHNIQYTLHLLLQSKFLPLFYLSTIILFSNLFNSIILCEADNDGITNNEIVKNENNTTVALMLFAFSILLSIWVIPHFLDGTLIDRIVEIINEKPYEEVYTPATPQEVMDWAEEWLKKELGFEGKSEAEINKILFGIKKK